MNPLNKIHNFKDSLAVSHKADCLPCWEETYRKAFPSFKSMTNHRIDGVHQRNGIDRSITLENSKQILIDEKVRGKNYGDIALEYWSDEKRKIRGWVCKDLLSDYIAYAIAPVGICYLLPVIQLQAAWKKFGDHWKAKYPFRIKAKNYDPGTGRHWETISVGVRPEDLYPAIGSFLRISFSPFEFDENTGVAKIIETIPEIKSVEDETFSDFSRSHEGPQGRLF